MAKSGTLKVRVIGDTKPFAKSMKGLSGTVGKAAGKIAKVGAMAFAAAGAAAVTGAFKVASFGDEIAKSAGKAGLGVEQFQELRFAFGQGGVEAKTMDTALLKFNKRLGESAVGTGTADDAFESLNVKLKDADGNVRDAGGAMDEILPKLAGIESDAQRAALAGDLFGQRAGPELAAALSDGVEGIDDARQKAQDLGIVMGEDAAEAAEKFTDQFDDIKQAAGGLLRKGLTPVMGFLSDTVFPGVQKIIKVFGEDGLSGVWAMVQKKFAEALPIIGEKLGELGEKFVAWVQEVGPPLLRKLGGLLAKLGEWVVTVALPALGEKLVQWGKAFVEWVGPQIPPMLVELGKLLGALGEWLITTALPALGEKLVEWGVAFAKWVGPAIPPMLVEMVKMQARLIKWVLTEALPAIAEALIKWGKAFAGWVLTEALPGLLENSNKLRKRLLEWITTEALPAIVTKLGEWAGAFGDWVLDAIAALPGLLADFASDLLGWVGEMPGRIASKAVGMWDGITDAFRSALNWIIRLWNGVEFTLPSFGGLSVAGQQVIPAFTGPTLGTPDIPTLHQGGVFRAPTPGGEGLALLKDRERVSTPAQAAQDDTATREQTRIMQEGFRILAEALVRTGAANEREVAALVRAS